MDITPHTLTQTKYLRHIPGRRTAYATDVSPAQNPLKHEGYFKTRTTNISSSHYRRTMSHPSVFVLKYHVAERAVCCHTHLSQAFTCRIYDILILHKARPAHILRLGTLRLSIRNVQRPAPRTTQTHAYARLTYMITHNVHTSRAM